MIQICITAQMQSIGFNRLVETRGTLLLPFKQAGAMPSAMGAADLQDRFLASRPFNSLSELEPYLPILLEQSSVHEGGERFPMWAVVGNWRHPPTHTLLSEVMQCLDRVRLAALNSPDSIDALVQCLANTFEWAVIPWGSMGYWMFAMMSRSPAHFDLFSNGAVAKCDSITESSIKLSDYELTSDRVSDSACSILFKPEAEGAWFGRFLEVVQVNARGVMVITPLNDISFEGKGVERCCCGLDLRHDGNAFEMWLVASEDVLRELFRTSTGMTRGWMVLPHCGDRDRLAAVAADLYGDYWHKSDLRWLEHYDWFMACGRRYDDVGECRFGARDEAVRRQLMRRTVKDLEQVLIAYV